MQCVKWECPDSIRHRYTMNGATWSSTNEITFMSGANINGRTFVPEAPTTSLLGFDGLLLIGLLLRRRRRAKA
jgi:hypothetical protein